MTDPTTALMRPDPAALAPLEPAELLAAAARAASDAASAAVFAAYRARRPASSLRRQGADTAAFRAFLADLALEAGELECDPEAWRPVTWGPVAAFVEWQLLKGYAIGTVNVRLSTVKTYMGLAHSAGAVDAAEYARARGVRAFGRRVGVERLSAHDLRHAWATDACRNGTDVKSLQDADEWSSPSMPLRYVESAEIANAGVRLSSV